MKSERELMYSIVKNVEQVIYGKTATVAQIVIALVSGGHVLIEDVPGVGKTSLVSALAKSVSCSFNRVQFTPDVLPSDITGYTMLNPKSGELEFRKGAIMSNIILADEINRTSPKTQSSMLEAMEEGQITVDGVTYALPKPFMVLATQNPIEYLGTYPLPEAQLDRFIMKVSVSYPDRASEMQMLVRNRTQSPLETLVPVADSDDIIRLQTRVKDVFVHESVASYIIDIVGRTRALDGVMLGASPRASLALYRTSQALAMMSGREYVVPDDVKTMAMPVLSHRIILTREAKVRKLSVKDLINIVLSSVQVPQTIK